MKIKVRNNSFIILTALAVSLTSLHASDPFAIDLVATDGSGLHASAGGSNFPDLVTSASITYAGVPNAITATVNSSGTHTVLTFNSTGQTVTFNGPTRSNVTHQVENLVKKNTNGVYGSFVATIQAQSKVGNIDGNPS